MGQTRIIAGEARGRKITVPPEGTRPTSDRAREGLFSSCRYGLDLRVPAFLICLRVLARWGWRRRREALKEVVLVENDPPRQR